MSDPLTALALYKAMCDYVQDKGWQRQPDSPGWWWHHLYGERLTVGAVDEQLEADGIDTREEPHA